MNQISFLEKCDKIFCGNNSYHKRQHFETLEGSGGTVYFLYKGFKASHISKLCMEGEWPQNDPFFDLTKEEWSIIFESNLNQKEKQWIDSKQ